MNKHRITLPDGTVATRSSKNRTYTHVVALGPVNAGHLVTLARKSIERCERGISEHQHVIDFVESGGEFTVRNDSFGPNYSLPNGSRVSVAFRAEDPKEGALDWAREGVEALQLSAARDLAKIAELEAGPEFVGTWVAASWASRADLAEKATTQFRHLGREVRALPID